MIGKERLIINRQGNYIRHLRVKRNLSVEAFADRLNIKPNELKEIEDGNAEAPGEVIRQLLSIPKVTEDDMYRVFGERWERFVDNDL